jgi:hypothetical protein
MFSSEPVPRTEQQPLITPRRANSGLSNGLAGMMGRTEIAEELTDSALPLLSMGDSARGSSMRRADEGIQSTLKSQHSRFNKFQGYSEQGVPDQRDSFDNRADAINNRLKSIRQQFLEEVEKDGTMDVMHTICY